MKRSQQPLWTGLALAAGLCLAIPSAQGVLITRGATTLFDSAGFETAPSVTPHSWESQQGTTPVNTPTDNNPTPVGTTFTSPAGSYWVTEGQQQDVQVTSATASANDPGAASGNNYLRMVRGGAGSTTVVFTAGYQGAGTDPVRVTFMLYVASANRSAGIALTAGSNPPVRLQTSASTDNVEWLNASGAVTNTGVKFIANQWQTWVIEYMPSATTFSLSVDGQSNHAVPSATPGIFRALSMYGGGTGSKFYVDTAPIPEPATAGVITVLGGLLATRRHR